jgi:hypothetical protein
MYGPGLPIVKIFNVVIEILSLYAGGQERDFAISPHIIIQVIINLFRY